MCRRPAFAAAASRIAAASAVGEPAGTKVVPEYRSAASTSPPTAVTTTGSPWLIAMCSGPLAELRRYGSTTRSAAAKNASTSASATYRLTKVTRSAAGEAAISSAGRVQPSQVSPTTVSVNSGGSAPNASMRSSSPLYGRIVPKNSSRHGPSEVRGAGITRSWWSNGPCSATSPGTPSSPYASRSASRSNREWTTTPSVRRSSGRMNSRT